MSQTGKTRKGAAAVEFAIVLPLLIIVLFGIIEFSIVLYDKAMITNASREGARAGIVAQIPRVTDGEITTVVNTYCQSHLITLGAANNPVTTVARTGPNFGDEITVTVQYNYGFLVLPRFITTMSGTMTLTATSVMRLE